MTTTEAEIDVISVGMLEVLSVGKGDLKLTVSGTEEEIEKGRRVIEEMLRKGYTIFVETDDGPTRVQSFNPKRMTYTISEVPLGTELPSGPAAPAALPPGKPPAKPRKKVGKKEVPVAGSRATAVGKTAGG
jgi:hypothetical protein